MNLYNTINPQRCNSSLKNENLKNVDTVELLNKLGQSFSLPDCKRNFCTFDSTVFNEIVERKEKTLPLISNFLSSAIDERQVLAGLSVLDRMLDSKVQGIDKLYPVIARFNDITSPNVQVYLAGIYRKTQLPEAFGPLMKMMGRQTFYPNSPYFDPTEEIGGAILEYLRAKSAPDGYNNH